jgi:hypothetical protein
MLPPPPPRRVSPHPFVLLALFLVSFTANLVFFELLRVRAPRVLPLPTPFLRGEYNASLLRGCSKVYVDLGTNIGVQLRKLYEPEKYPGSPIHPRFAKWFGGPSFSDVCAVGFEPNPVHMQRLDFLEHCYAKRKGWRATVLRATAYDSDVSELEFDLDAGSPEHLWWGARLLPTPLPPEGGGERKTTTVPSVNMTRFFLDVVFAEPRLAVGVKFDIEGAEYAVLKSLEQGGVLPFIKGATVEWHDHPDEGGFRSRFSERWPSFEDLDDERYANDGVAWPSEC